MTNSEPENGTGDLDDPELVGEIADTIETFMEKHVHMARRLYPDVWKRQLAEELVTMLKKNHNIS